MQLRPSLPIALLALLLAWPKNVEAAGSSVPLSAPLLSASTVAALQRLAASLEGTSGYGLVACLDEIAGSHDYQRLLLTALMEFDQLDSDDLRRVTLEFEYADLYARFKSPQLRPLLARTYAALVATFELTPPEWVQDAIAQTDGAVEGRGSWLSVDELDGPARLRSHLRRMFRGSVALMCLPFVGSDENLRVELFAHAATGAETNLRFTAALSPNPERAHALLGQLRLEPIDLAALERRQEQLEAARASLQEAREHVPQFRLPPDPSFE